MSRFCPLKNGPALYLDCKECDERICEIDDAPVNIRQDKPIKEEIKKDLRKAGFHRCFDEP